MGIKKFLICVLAVLLSFSTASLTACKGVENPSNTDVETPDTGEDTPDEGGTDSGTTTPDEGGADSGETTPDDGTDSGETKPEEEKKPSDGNDFIEGEGENDLPIVPVG